MTIVVGTRSIIASSSARALSISTASRRIAVGASVARKHLADLRRLAGRPAPGGQGRDLRDRLGRRQDRDGLRAERQLVDRRLVDRADEPRLGGRRRRRSEAAVSTRTIDSARPAEPSVGAETPSI